MKMIIKFLSIPIVLSACQQNTAPNPTDINSETQTVTSSSQASSVNITTVVSAQSFTETEAALRAGFESRGLKLFTVVDHGAGAKSVGEDIGGSKLFIFGNPKAGTPLMQSEPHLGLALPMKILLREANGRVTLHRDDIAASVRSYGVTDQEARLDKISGALDAVIAEAAGN